MLNIRDHNHDCKFGIVEYLECGRGIFRGVVCPFANVFCVNWHFLVHRGWSCQDVLA